MGDACEGAGLCRNACGGRVGRERVEMIIRAIPDIMKRLSSNRSMRQEQRRCGCVINGRASNEKRWTRQAAKPQRFRSDFDASRLTPTRNHLHDPATASQTDASGLSLILHGIPAPDHRPDLNLASTCACLTGRWLGGCARVRVQPDTQPQAAPLRCVTVAITR